MEDIDIDSLVDIPDTPDRLSSRRKHGGHRVGNLYAADHVGGSNSASLDRLRGRDRVVAENGQNRKRYRHTQKLSGGVDETEHRKNTIVLSPLEKARENAPLSRKTTMERSRNSIREQYMDKGKAPFSKLPSKSSGFGKDHAMVNLTGRNMHKPEMEFPQGGSENCSAGGKNEGNVPRNGGSYIYNSSSNSATSRNNCKGKEKINDIGFEGVGSVADHAKGVDLSCGSTLRLDKQLPAYQNVVPPRATAKRRLVRNGCISPQNIAIRAKQFNEQSQNSFNSEQNFGNVVSNNPCIDISEIIAGDNNYGKGKGVAHPRVSMDQDINCISLSGSAVNNGEASGTNGDSIRDECFEEKGGWRSAHNRSKNAEHAASHRFSRFKNVGCHVSQQNENKVVKRNDASRGSNRIPSGCLENCDATETAPVIFSKFNQKSEPSHAENLLSKRQMKHVLSSGNSGESSRVIPNDTDIVFLGSSWGSSSLGSSRINTGHHLNVSDLDELSEMRGANVDANHGDCVNDEESEARARQVEADEILARELQEQLYHEVSIYGNNEIDENIARALQQEEDTFPSTSNRSIHEPQQLLNLCLNYWKHAIQGARISDLKSRRDLVLVILPLHMVNEQGYTTTLSCLQNLVRLAKAVNLVVSEDLEPNPEFVRDREHRWEVWRATRLGYENPQPANLDKLAFIQLCHATISQKRGLRNKLYQDSLMRYY
ncbi:E3 ubiquitin-protein ligase SDIR1-like protein [Gossypium australe]|uniref:E3 ubiquitin-protein ligase SDIR1-like protein n=1 Tax=Gossypium australe TaxID=47621 RepID=A0A5B6UBN0_9ROSI|nr:E3 ubiquitin-protein ligase SDIR1-like protein [Gossypium australe]